MVAVNKQFYAALVESESVRHQFDGWLAGVAGRSSGESRRLLHRGLASRVLRERAFKKTARAYAEYVATQKAKGDGKILDFLKWLVEFAVKEILPIILPLFA